MRAAAIFDRALLSTDSEEIAEVGRAYGLEAPFLRPPELAARRHADASRDRARACSG